jgi:large subunit ribosomal protein L5
MQKFGYKTVMQVPRIRKITVNMGVGETTSDKKVLDQRGRRHGEDRRPEAGGHPGAQIGRELQGARRLPRGCMVTLRGARMYEFLDRLVNIAMPRIRDFRGVSNRGPSTAAATTAWASRNRSSSPRSSTTRSTRCGE